MMGRSSRRVSPPSPPFVAAPASCLPNAASVAGATLSCHRHGLCVLPPPSRVLSRRVSPPSLPFVAAPASCLPNAASVRALLSLHPPRSKARLQKRDWNVNLVSTFFKYKYLYTICLCLCSQLADSSSTCRRSYPLLPPSCNAIER